MAVLSSGQRAKLPSSDFAGPGRSFPIPDKAHAIAAERLVGRAEAHGSINAEQAAHIKAVARKKLGAALKSRKGTTSGDSMSLFPITDRALALRQNRRLRYWLYWTKG